jgi:hypothetical protein
LSAFFAEILECVSIIVNPNLFPLILLKSIDVQVSALQTAQSLYIFMHLKKVFIDIHFWRTKGSA